MQQVENKPRSSRVGSKAKQRSSWVGKYKRRLADRRGQIMKRARDEESVDLGGLGKEVDGEGAGRYLLQDFDTLMSDEFFEPEAKHVEKSLPSGDKERIGQDFTEKQELNGTEKRLDEPITREATGEEPEPQTSEDEGEKYTGARHGEMLEPKGEGGKEDRGGVRQIEPAPEPQRADRLPSADEQRSAADELGKAKVAATKKTGLGSQEKSAERIGYSEDQKEPKSHWDKLRQARRIAAHARTTDKVGGISKHGTKMALRWAWGAIIPTLGCSLIYILIHFCCRYLGQKKETFCAFSAEWAPSTLGIEDNKPLGGFGEYLEIMVFIVLLLVFVVILVGVLIIFIVIPIYAYIYPVEFIEMVGWDTVMSITGGL